jgi:hypothetical protein
MALFVSRSWAIVVRSQSFSISYYTSMALSGAGKASPRSPRPSHRQSLLQSTLARRLATDLQVEFVSLDHVHWQPGWVETPAPEFRQKIRDILGELYGSGWVVDGCYAHKLADIVDELATDIICSSKYFSRLFLSQ